MVHKIYVHYAAIESRPVRDRKRKGYHPIYLLRRPVGVISPFYVDDCLQLFHCHSVDQALLIVKCVLLCYVRPEKGYVLPWKIYWAQSFTWLWPGGFLYTSYLTHDIEAHLLISYHGDKVSFLIHHNVVSTYPGMLSKIAWDVSTSDRGAVRVQAFPACRCLHFSDPRCDYLMSWLWVVCVCTLRCASTGLLWIGNTYSAEEIDQWASLTQPKRSFRYSSERMVG